MLRRGSSRVQEVEHYVKQREKYAMAYNVGQQQRPIRKIDPGCLSSPL